MNTTIRLTRRERQDLQAIGGGQMAWGVRRMLRMWGLLVKMSLHYPEKLLVDALREVSDSLPAKFRVHAEEDGYGE